MSTRLQIVAILALVAVLLFILELVRRRRLAERYALLWIVASLGLLVLAIWDNLLARVSDAVGIQVPSNALFLAAFAFVLLLLVHFSLSISKLSDHTRVLAQRLARAEAELRHARAEAGLPEVGRRLHGGSLERQDGGEELVRAGEAEADDDAAS